MTTTIEINTQFKIGEISPRLFGSFIEHMGSVVYTGIYEPDHPETDEHGFRQDVLNKIKALNLGIIRYPGGNFTSGYDWTDTIGPIAQRKTKLELAWRGLEPNTFGLNEFFVWLKLIGSEPMLTINLGTKGIDEARNIVEYCNFPEGTYWSELRRSHGVAEPHNVKVWCLGNELDGHWQVGRKTAYEYGRLANESSKAMKLVDDSIETVLVGSSTPKLASYPEWDRVSLEQAYEAVDYLALHNYIDRCQDEDLSKKAPREPDDTPTYLARSIEFDQQIETVIATCDYVKALVRSDKTMYLAFDEWNVHNFPEKEHHDFELGSPIDWCHFSMEDTLLFASMGLSILRRADRIKITCQSLLVNTIPLILTDAKGQSWCNPTYYVLKDLSNLAKGTVLQSAVSGTVYNTDRYQNVPFIDSVIVDSGTELICFVVNRSSKEERIIVNTTSNFSGEIFHSELSSENLDDKNTRENPTCVQPKEVKGHVSLVNQQIKITVAPYSWNTISIGK